MLRIQDVNYSLIYAVREGRLETAMELINRFGLAYSKAWSNGYVLLCDAVKCRHSAIIKLLLTSGCKINPKYDGKSDSPLHFAAKNGDIEVVEMLLNKYAKTDVKNQDGDTPLLTAIVNKNLKVTELLLKHKADVNASNNVGMSPLHVAVEARCLEIVKLLLGYGAYVNYQCINSISRKGLAPLHIAVENYSKLIVTLLLSSGANVDIKGDDCSTPLHIATKRGYMCIAVDLLNHGACINSFTLKENYTPLHFASQLGNKDAVKLFLNRGADINARSIYNETPVYIATRKGHITVVNMLLQHGAEVDSHGKDGKTILFLAVQKGHLMFVEDVLKYCPNINNQSNRNSLKTAVHGCGEKYEKIVEALLEYGLIFGPEDASDPDLLHDSVKRGYVKIVDKLLKYGADVNVLRNSTFKGGFTPLHSATKYEQDEVAELLISYEANINVQDGTGKTPIFYSVENGNLKLTKLLLSKDANVKDNPELLKLAVMEGSIEIIKALLQHGADINAIYEYGATALHFTALSDKEGFFGYISQAYHDDFTKGEIAQLLLSKGANVDAETKNGVTALHIAIQKRHATVIEALLEYNANVNSVGKSDIIPLHLSVQNRSKGISRMLLNKGANVNAKQNNGCTALHIATENGHKEVVELLLEYGAEVDSKMKGDIVTQNVIVRKFYPENITCFLVISHHTNSRDKCSRTALNIASQKGYYKVVGTLLDYGADVNITGRNNHTPLESAIAKTSSHYGSWSNAYLYFDVCEWIAVVKTLIRYLVKMKTENLYICEKNLLSMNSYKEIELSEHYALYNMNTTSFENRCEDEVASMKCEKINGYVSFYDILAKGANSLAVYMRNENIVQILKSSNNKTKFPIYANMITSNFRKGMKRKGLLEQCNTIFLSLFNPFSELPYDCTERIISYLSNKDLKILIDVCKIHSISCSITNVNDLWISCNEMESLQL